MVHFAYDMLNMKHNRVLQVDAFQEYYSQVLQIYCRKLYPSQPFIFPKALGKGVFTLVTRRQNFDARVKNL